MRRCSGGAACAPERAIPRVPARYCPVSESGLLLDLARRALRHQLPAQPSRAGTQIDHVIGALDGLGVVLHHQHGVAEIAQAAASESSRRSLSRGCRPMDGSSSTYSTPRSFEPICVASRMRCASPPESVAAERLQAQVFEADPHQEFQPVANFVHRSARRSAVPALGQLPVLHAVERPRHRQSRQLGDGHALHLHREARRLQALALAIRAHRRRHVLHEPLVIGFARDFLLVILVQDAEQARLPGAPSSTSGLRFFDSFSNGFWIGIFRRVASSVQVLRSRSSIRRRSQPSVEQRPRRVHDHLRRIETPAASQAHARLARAKRTVERKRPRLELRHARAAFRDTPASANTAAPARSPPPPAPARPASLVAVSIDASRRFSDFRLDQQPVHHHLDGVILALVERDLFVELAAARHRCAPARIPGAPVSPVPSCTRPCARARSAPGSSRAPAAPVAAPARRICCVDCREISMPAGGAMRHANGGVQHAQVIVDLRDGAHGRARAAAGGLLLDRNRRAQAVDRIHLRPLHLIQKLARVGRQRLDVAPLPLGVDRVEGQRRLARSAQAR